MVKSIFVDKNVVKIPFRWDGKTFEFEIQPLSWYQQNQAANKALVVLPGQKKASFDVNTYAKEVLPSLIKSTGELKEFNPQDPMIWMKLDRDFGQALEEQILDPYASPKSHIGELSEEDEKN